MEALSVVRQVGAAAELPQIKLLEGGDSERHHFYQRSRRENNGHALEDLARRGFSSQVAAEGRTSKSKNEGHCTTSTFTSDEKPDKLHEWLAREIESRFNRPSSACSKAATLDSGSRRVSTGAKQKTSLLEALIEGRKGWLEQKTVIVDIDNSRRRESNQEVVRTGAAIREQAGRKETTDRADSLIVDQTNKQPDTQNSKTLAANKQNRTLSAKQKEGAVESRESKGDKNQDKSTIAALSSGSDAAVAAEASAGAGAGASEDTSKSKGEPQVEAPRRDPDSRQQPQDPKDKRLPTFGGAPTRLTRLPYYSYYGKARNVEIVSASDRKNRLAADQSGDSATSVGSSQRSLSSGASGSKIPTLSQAAASGGAAGESEIDQEDRKELELNRRSRQQHRDAGYSNISNLFPSKQMSARQRQSDLSASYSRRNIRFSSAERDRARLQQQQSSSLLNLNQQAANSRARSSERNKVASSSGFDRRNSLSTNYNRSNRSMNSLNASPYSNTSDNIGVNTAGSAMRRQNSNASYVNNRQRPPSTAYQGRPASASGYMGRGHHRSPSASSLLYGSAGMSPYGPPPVDPDCPVHGYSPVNGVHSKSSQHLASAGGNMDSADLLYEPYNSFYDRPGQLQPAPNSLYSPTSPPLMNQRAGSTYGNSNRQLNSAPAYYNSSSRFSMYHSPSGGAAKTSLAPTNEQLRRILGYQPHTKPIYLHPQWAYSRPFIHLQGTRSPSPGSPMLDDDDDREIRPRFEPYNQLHDTQAIRAVDFHPSGEVYAVGSNSRALRICAYPADYELRHFGQDHVTTAPRVLFKFLQVHRGSIYCVRFNATGLLLATGSNDQTVHIVRYNPVTHSPDGDEYRLTMHDGTVRDLCFIDDPTNGSSVLLSAGGGDNKIYVTDCDTITPFQSMAGHTQMIMALHHWGGANFVSASYDRTIRFWDLRTRACTSIISAPPGYGTAGKRVGPGAPACAVQVDSSGRLLASGHSDSTCMLYDIRGARIIQAFKPHDDEIRTVSFSPKSYYLLTGGYDGRIVLNDLQGDLTQPLPAVCVAESDDKIVQSKWHPSDFTFMTTSADKTATLWALPTE